MSNILRKIVEIKLRYINIAMLILILVGPVFALYCISQERLFWDHMVFIYLREKGYNVSKFKTIEELDMITTITELYRDIPPYTDREARALTHFWDEWIKRPMLILAGLIGVFFIIRFVYTSERVDGG